MDSLWRVSAHCCVRPKIHCYTGYKRTCAVEQAVSCIWPVNEAKRALLSTGGWFSAHPGCSILKEHVASTQGSDWLLSKPTFLSQVAERGDVPTGSKNNGLNQPKAWEPCTMHCMYHKKSCRIMCLASKQLWQFEQRVLQTESSEGGLQWQREGQQLRSTVHPIHDTHVLRNMSQECG